MSTKVEVFTSPGWEAEVDTDWAEGLFAVFLRSAKAPRRRPRSGTKVIGDNVRSDGVILLTVRKDGAVETVTEAPPPGQTDLTPTTPTSETRRSKRPRGADEGTAKLRDSTPGGERTAPARGGTSKRSAPRSRPIPPPPPPARSRPIPPPPPVRGRPHAAALPPARPARTAPPVSPTARQQTVRDSIPRDLRTTVPAAERGTPLDEDGIKDFLFEMGALVKYGHGAQVRAEFDKRLPEHAEDPRFRRLMIAFYFEHDMPAEGIEALFGLASLYFDRRDLPRMRECLDEILRHEPGSRRARKMRELLDKRPGRTRPPSSER